MLDSNRACRIAMRWGSWSKMASMSSARSLDEGLLDGIAGVCFLHNHSPQAKEDTIERHRLHTVLKRPQASNVGPNTLAITKARAGDEGDVRMEPYVAKIS